MKKHPDFDELIGRGSVTSPDNDQPFSKSIDNELAQVFERYASALDSGDNEAADAILAECPAIGEEFRAPIHGLYLLGRASRQKHFDADQSDSPQRKRLGDFEIDYELGRGGMGIVYAATQCSLQRRVALKVLPFTAVLDPRHVARFRNEAQAAASLHHPNIVPVYAVGCERGVHYYSMQLIEGQSLEQFIDQFRERSRNDGRPTSNSRTVGSLSTVVSIQTRNYVRNVLEIGAQAAQAIDYAHQQGIVHRDIKPSNLMLDQTGKIWVTDFGLARCRGNSNLTSQGDRIGTARYMSPEQAAGRTQQVDFRTDIYSLGVTLYEMLTLRPAFAATEREPLLAAIETTDPTPMRSINSAIPVDLDTIICKAIAKSPLDRYQSAGEFAADLLRCLAGNPIHARRPTIVDRVGKSIAKRKWFVASLACAFLILATATSIAASVFYQQRLREQDVAEKARFYLQQAHKTVDRFGNTLTDELQQIPGTESLRAKLIGEAIGYYDDFLKYAQDVPELKIETAKANRQLANLHDRAGNESEAFASIEMAIDRLNGTWSDATTAADAKFEQAICLDMLGLFEKRKNDFEKSREAFVSAERKLESFDRPVPPKIAAALAQVQANLALLRWENGENNLAVSDFEKALATLTSQGEALMVDLGLRSTYHKIYGNYVALLSESDLDLAIKVLNESIEALTRTNANLDEDARDLADENAEHLADMQNNLAVLLNEKGDGELAKGLAEKALEFWHAKSRLNPRDVQIAMSLATVQNTLGEINWRASQSGPAGQAFAEAEKGLRQVLEQAPNRAEPISRLAGVLHNQSLVAVQNNDFEKATNLICSALSLQLNAVKLAPNNQRYEKMLAFHERMKTTIETRAKSFLSAPVK